MRLLILGAILCLVLSSPTWGQPVEPSTRTSEAAEKVEFNSASRPIGRLQEMRARERGEDPQPRQGDRLEGHLSKPEGSGPFPAIILLPRCDGLTPFTRETLPQVLVSWGYVALAIDSVTTRKVEDPCSTPLPAHVDRMADAYGGLFHLATLPFVDPDRIGLLGMGNGGRVALTLADASQATEMVSNPKRLTFKAAVTYYPGCYATGEKLSYPILIMIGQEDQVYRAQACESLKAGLAPDSAPVELTLYPGVHHGFLEPEIGTGMTLYGLSWVEYNEKAAEDSLRRTREFLAKTLGGTPR